MNMKRKLNNISLFGLLVFFSGLSACNNKNEKHQQVNGHEPYSYTVYTCTMHPEVISDQAGICPRCKMKLVPLLNEKLPQIISSNKEVLSNQATVKMQSGSYGKTEKMQGFIIPAQNRNRSVAARFGGRIEKLYVKFSNQYVKQGESIMDIYSPELRTYQEEHLFLLKSNTGRSLIEKSREKLSLLGFTEDQIIQLEKKGTVASTVTVYSPAKGYVFFTPQSLQEKTTDKNTSAMNTMNMSAKTNNESSYAASALQIREGMYVNETQTLFRVNDLQEVWALVSVANQYVNHIYKDQSIEIVSESNPSKIIKGKVALIEQTFEEANQRFARIRIVLPNSNNSLIINSLVTAQFTLSNKNISQVPASAVYKTGLNAYVWVKTDTTRNGTGIFQLRKIIAGPNYNGMTIIKGGLSPLEEIAKDAGFMVDSETFLNVN